MGYHNRRRHCGNSSHFCNNSDHYFRIKHRFLYIHLYNNYEIMKMYASCPICGYKLCKGESGSDVDILCPRCGKLVRVVITETNTTCTPTDAPKKAAKELN